MTAPFLGDIALSYAIHYAVVGSPLPFRFGPRGPDVRTDYREFRTRATVGVAEASVEYLPPEFVASSFNSEGYEQKAISSMESKYARPRVSNSPWRPWRQIQSLAPGNEFTFATIGDQLPQRFTVRMGLGRGTLVEVRREEDALATVAINRHTVEHILGREMSPAAVPHVLRQTHLAEYDVWYGVPHEVGARLMGPSAA